MSLLMQALKKADRTRREALPGEDDATRPSETFDGILALTPDDVIAGRVPPAPPAADTAALSLEALDAAEARANAPAGSVDEQVPALTPAIPAPHDPTPRQSRRVGDCAPRQLGQAQPPAIDSTPDAHAPLAWNTAARPAAPPPDAANAPLPSAQARLQALTLQDVPPALMPEPHFVSAASLPNESAPALGTEAIAPMRDFEAAIAAAAPPAHATGPALYPRQAHGAGAGASTAPAAPHADAAALGPQGASAANADADAAFSPSTSASRAQGTAARARAAAQAAALQDQPGRDPARVRLAMLGGALALVTGTLAGVYWYALTAPGPGAHLPPVPMPPPGATTGPAPIAVVVTAGGQPDGQGLQATALPEAAAPGASALPTAAPEPLQPAPANTASPSARATTPAGPNGGGRMPSDDDLQRALQQQSQAATAGEPQAGARPAANPPTPAPQTTQTTTWGAYPTTNPANPASPSNSAYGANPALLPGGAPAADIHVARGAVPQRINAALLDGYQAFMAGNDSSAAQHYASALRQDPNNRDALLGTAAIAARRNDVAAATSGYQRLLELNPNDADAQAGLLALRPGDPGQTELRLKDLLRRDPGAGPLEFALGNLYAQQGRWPDAQQAYFRAYSKAPENADYVFNLAVGLDRLSQRTLALTYYQRALELSRTSPAAFDRSAARRRADQLAAPEGRNSNGRQP